METGKAQKKAKQLLQMADAVERSTQNRRHQLEQMRRSNIEAESKNEDEGEDTMVDEEEDDCVQEEAVQDLPEQFHVPLDENASVHSVSTERTSKRQSKRKIIAELREQLSASHQALVAVRENAALKQRKHEVEKQELEASLQAEQAEVEARRSECRKLQLKTQSLERKLTSAVGADRIEWLTNLEANQSTLMTKIETLETEKEKLMTEREALLKQMCASCRAKGAVTQQPIGFLAASWYSARALLHLNDELKTSQDSSESPEGSSREAQSMTTATKPVGEADATTGGGAAPSTSDSSLSRSKSGGIQDEFDKEVEAMERKLKEELNTMRKEWAEAPLQGRNSLIQSVRTSYRKSGSYSKGAPGNLTLGERPRNRGLASFLEKTGSVQDEKGSPDKLTLGEPPRNRGLASFLERASSGLHDEEMDEEKSFYSVQRSVRSLPTTNSETRKSNKRNDRKSKEYNPEKRHVERTLDRREQLRKSMSVHHSRQMGDHEDRRREKFSKSMSIRSSRELLRNSLKKTLGHEEVDERPQKVAENIQKME